MISHPINQPFSGHYFTSSQGVLLDQLNPPPASQRAKEGPDVRDPAGYQAIVSMNHVEVDFL